MLPTENAKRCADHPSVYKVLGFLNERFLICRPLIWYLHERFSAETRNG